MNWPGLGNGPAGSQTAREVRKVPTSGNIYSITLLALAESVASTKGSHSEFRGPLDEIAYFFVTL